MGKVKVKNKRESISIQESPGYLIAIWWQILSPNNGLSVKFKFVGSVDVAVEIALALSPRKTLLASSRSSQNLRNFLNVC